MISLIIIATFLIALFIYYYYYHKVEKFTEPPQVNIQDAVDGLTQLLASVGSGNIPEGSPYVETLANIPSNSDLKMYLTSFSARTNYDNSVRIYIPEMHRWNNFIKENESFFVRGASDEVSASIRESGLKLKGVALEGLRSDEINMTDYTLKSFSATFFMKFNNVSSSNSYELFTISLESPNYARLTLIKVDANNSKLELQIGDPDGDSSNKITTQNIPNSNLIGISPVAITITCTISDSRITSNIFINNHTTNGAGVVVPVQVAITTTPTSYNLVAGNKLILGNSRMSINKNKTDIDANLLAFMFFSKALDTDTNNTITTYLATQNLPSTGLLSTLNSSATTQLQNIRNLIATNTATQGTLQAQLNACKATIAATPVVRAFGHRITMNGISSVSTEDLRACSVLEVKNRLTNAVAAASGTTATAPPFQINYPADVPASTTAIAP